MSVTSIESSERCCLINLTRRLCGTHPTTNGCWFKVIVICCVSSMRIAISESRLPISLFLKQEVRRGILLNPLSKLTHHRSIVYICAANNAHPIIHNQELVMHVHLRYKYKSLQYFIKFQLNQNQYIQ